MCSSNVWWSASCRRIKTKINADLMALLWSSSHVLQRNLVFRADLAIIFCRKSLCGENNVSIQHLVFCLWFVLLFLTWCCCTISASSNTFLPRNGVLRKETFRHWKISSLSVCHYVINHYLIFRYLTVYSSVFIVFQQVMVLQIPFLQKPFNILQPLCKTSPAAISPQ